MTGGPAAGASSPLGSALFWSFCDKWVSRLFTLIVFVILGRLLEPSAFGVISLASAYVAFIGVLVDAGFGKALVQQRTLKRADTGTALIVSGTIGAAFAAASFLLAPVIANLFGAPELSAVIQVLSIAVFVEGLASVPAALLERDMDFRALAARRALANLIAGAAAIFAALAGWGVWALVVQSLLISVIGAAIVWAAVWRRIAWGFRWESVRRLSGTSVGVLGIQLMTFANSQGDRVVVGALLGVEVLGQYFLAMRIVSLVVELLTAAFSNVGLSAFSRLQDEPQRLRDLLYRLTGTTSLATVPAFAFLGAFAPFVLPIVFGEQWDEAVPILQILVFLGVVNSLLVFDRSVLIAVGHAKSAFWLSAGQTAFGLILVICAAPWGVLMTAAAVVVRQYLFWPIRMIVLRRVIDLEIGRYLRSWLVAVGSLAVSWVFAAAATGAVGVWLGLVVFLAVYAVAYPLLARDFLAEISSLSRRLRRRGKPGRGPVAG